LASRARRAHNAKRGEHDTVRSVLGNDEDPGTGGWSGDMQNAFLGGVACKVSELAEVPVTLVR
jgi:hypothetical protein